jgi:hypothetical protein
MHLDGQSPVRPLPTIACILVVLTAGLLPSIASAARDRAPGFSEHSLELPGMPAALLPADMNGDGVDDLVVLVAYTAWNEVAETEQVEFDGIEGLVEVMNVVSALLDRRELRVYPGRPDAGGFEPYLPPLELDSSVHALSAGGPGEPLLAITDEGIAAVRLVEEDGRTTLTLEPLLEVETKLSGTGAFFSDFEFAHDLDRDGLSDLLLPGEGGWSVYRGLPDGFEGSPSATLVVPPKPPEEDGEPSEDTDSDRGDSDSEQGDDRRRKPRRPVKPRQPQIKDVNGDGRHDLVVFKVDRGRDPLVYIAAPDPLGGSPLAFAPAVEIHLPEERDHEEIVYLGDLDGDGRASVVAAEELEPGDEAGFKMEIEHAKEPDFRYRIYPLRPDLTLAKKPSSSFEAEGYTFEGESEHDDEGDEDIDIKLPGGFQDLDGDGRQDLVAITLDFSLVPLIFRALVLRSISLRMDFHPHCQRPDGNFRRVPDLDLSGKFKLNLRNVQVKHLSQFQGDFNGDGRADFVQLGRGKKVTIHQGGPGCTYPVKPDRQILLEREPRHLGLTRILDVDSNGRSDLYVVHPLKDPKSGESTPVRVDLYLSESSP